MAITDIKEFAHLTEEDLESFGRELDAVRRDIEDSRGEKDAAYIRRTIRLQRSLELGGRAVLLGSKYRPAWLIGTAMLSVSKIIENMELGHNVMHGQWDWMNDPEIHSVSWEWDQTGPSEQWKRAHNYSHHTYTNIVGMDHDIGFGILRMTRATSRGNRSTCCSRSPTWCSLRHSSGASRYTISMRRSDSTVETRSGSGSPRRTSLSGERLRGRWARTSGCSRL